MLHGEHVNILCFYLFILPTRLNLSSFAKSIKDINLFGHNFFFSPKIYQKLTRPNKVALTVVCCKNELEYEITRGILRILEEFDYEPADEA